MKKSKIFSLISVSLLAASCSKAPIAANQRAEKTPEVNCSVSSQEKGEVSCQNGTVFSLVTSFPYLADVSDCATSIKKTHLHFNCKTGLVFNYNLSETPSVDLVSCISKDDSKSSCSDRSSYEILSLPYGSEVEQSDKDVAVLEKTEVFLPYEKSYSTEEATESAEKALEETTDAAKEILDESKKEVSLALEDLTPDLEALTKESSEAAEKLANEISKVQADAEEKAAALLLDEEAKGAAALALEESEKLKADQLLAEVKAQAEALAAETLKAEQKAAEAVKAEAIKAEQAKIEQLAAEAKAEAEALAAEALKAQEEAKIAAEIAVKAQAEALAAETLKTERLAAVAKAEAEALALEAEKAEQAAVAAKVEAEKIAAQLAADALSAKTLKAQQDKLAADALAAKVLADTEAAKIKAEAEALAAQAAPAFTSGLKAEVYKIPTSTTALPNFSLLTPATEVVVKKLNLNQVYENTDYFGLSAKLYGKWVAIKLTGNIVVPSCAKACMYRITSDDGTKLYINGSLVVTNDGLHSNVRKTITLSLSAGQYPIEVQWFQGGGYMTLILEVSKDGGTTWTEVSSDELNH